MYFRYLYALILLLALGVSQAQAVPAQVVTGYMTTSGCPSVALTPCFVQYGAGGGGGGGAVTIADGADVTQGAIADAAATPGGTGTVSAKLRNATSLLNAPQGTVAPGAAPTNDIVIGCQYKATIPAATDTQVLAVQCDPGGRVRVNNQPTVVNAVSGTATQTSTTSTSLIGAVTSNRIYTTAFACYNSGASASVISFQDGSGGTTIYQTIVPAGGGSNLGAGSVLFKTTAGNALFFAPATASTTIGCSASGFSAL